MKVNGRIVLSMEKVLTSLQMATCIQENMIKVIKFILKRIGRPSGFGVYKWKNQSLYTGEFKGGLKHGKGKWNKTRELGSNCY